MPALVLNLTISCHSFIRYVKCAKLCLQELTQLKRFTEKKSEEWRQIYKALQLLEYLIKNGSEQVVDYARSHEHVVDMLRHFQYTSPDGRDQGMNVRNRSKEIANLLADTSKIRQVRKQAKANRQKLNAISGGGGSGFGGGSYGNSTYDSYDGPRSGFGGYSGGVYGDGGGFESGSYDTPSHSRQKPKDEEYHVEEEPALPVTKSTPPVPENPEPQKPQEVDLFSFDDFQSAGSASVPPPAAPASSQPAVSAPSQNDNILNLFQSSPTASKPTYPNFGNFTTALSNNMSNAVDDGFTSFQSANSPVSPNSSFAFPSNGSSFAPTTGATSNLQSSTGSAAKPKQSDAFGDLWRSASTKRTPTNSRASISGPMSTPTNSRVAQSSHRHTESLI